MKMEDLNLIRNLKIFYIMSKFNNVCYCYKSILVTLINCLLYSLLLISNEWMFFDVAKINVKGGDGGNGCMAVSIICSI